MAKQRVEYGDDARAARRSTIHTAAITCFSERGIAATSMADIADAAGMSRPALYQYFSDKHDIFASAFVALFDDHVDRALAALDSAEALPDRLDQFLQRFEGDLWERLSASPHADEIISAKSERVSDAVSDAVTPLWDGLSAHLAHTAPGSTPPVTARRATWIAVLRMSPAGLKADQPSVAEFRNRLRTLAHSVAADIDSTG